MFLTTNWPICLPLAGGDQDKNFVFGGAPVVPTPDQAQEQQVEQTPQVDLYFAARTSLLPRIVELVEEEGVTILTQKDASGHTVTHWAAQAGDVPILSWLLKRGAPVSEQSGDPTGMHPIHWACIKGKLEAMHLLIEQGADVNCLDKSGCTPLLIAAQYGQSLLVSYLVKNGADIKSIDHEEDTALHWGAYKGNAEVVQLFLLLGLDIHHPDKYGQTPLHLASMRGNMDAVQLICEHADDQGMKAALLSLKDGKGKTPQMLALDKKQNRVEVYLKGQSSGLSCSSLLSPATLIGRMEAWKRWPYYFVICQLFWGSGVYTILVNDPAISTNTNKLLVTTIVWIVMLVLFYKCTFTDPGTISLDGVEHQRYKAAIEQLATTGKMESVGKLRLCHACQLDLPVRAKFCKELKKCVKEFDHYCPFVNNAVGKNNYPFFYFYLIFHSTATFMVSHSCYEYVSNQRHVFVFITMVDSFFMFLFGMALAGTHVFLTFSWLTTNEQVNFNRYDYFKTPNGGAPRNPFDKGWVKNCGERLCYIRGHVEDDEGRLLDTMA